MHCVLHAAEKALTTVCRKHPALFVCLATQGASVAWSCFLFFSLYFVKMPDWTHLHVCQEALLRAVVVLIVCVGVCSVRSLAPVFSRTHTAKYNIVLQNKNLARLFTASVCAFSAHRLLWHDFWFFFYNRQDTNWDVRSQAPPWHMTQTATAASVSIVPLLHHHDSKVHIRVRNRWARWVREFVGNVIKQQLTYN